MKGDKIKIYILQGKGVIMNKKTNMNWQWVVWGMWKISVLVYKFEVQEFEKSKIARKGHSYVNTKQHKNLLSAKVVERIRIEFKAT